MYLYPKFVPLKKVLYRKKFKQWNAPFTAPLSNTPLCLCYECTHRKDDVLIADSNGFGNISHDSISIQVYDNGQKNIILILTRAKTIIVWNFFFSKYLGGNDELVVDR